MHTVETGCFGGIFAHTPRGGAALTWPAVRWCGGAAVRRCGGAVVRQSGEARWWYGGGGRVLGSARSKVMRDAFFLRGS